MSENRFFQSFCALVGAATLVCGMHLFLVATSDWDAATATISIELSSGSAPAGPVAELDGTPAPVAERPKKRRTGLIVGIIVLLLLVVGAGSVYFFVLRSTPEKTLSAVCNAYTSGDAQGLFNQLSARAQSQTSVAKISQGLQAAKQPPINGIKTCTFNNVQENGSTATADMTFTFGNAALNSLVKPFKFQLVNENGTWKLDSAAQPAPSQQ